MNRIKLFSRYDLLVLIAISALAIILLIPNIFSGDKLTATITVDGEVVETIDLNKSTGIREIKLQSNPEVKIRVENGKIRVSEAECHDKLCVNCGWLETDGATAVCLPAKVVVSVDSHKSDSKAPDVITY